MSQKQSFKAGDRVRYVPAHATGPEDPCCEDGVVSSTPGGSQEYAFVRFGDNACGSCCKTAELILLEDLDE